MGLLDPKYIAMLEKHGDKMFSKRFGIVVNLWS